MDVPLFSSLRIQGGGVPFIIVCTRPITSVIASGCGSFGPWQVLFDELVGVRRLLTPRTRLHAR